MGNSGNAAGGRARAVSGGGAPPRVGTVVSLPKNGYVEKGPRSR